METDHAMDADFELPVTPLALRPQINAQATYYSRYSSMPDFCNSGPVIACTSKSGSGGKLHCNICFLLYTKFNCISTFFCLLLFDKSLVELYV